jgi:hypothetical protein
MLFIQDDVDILNEAPAACTTCHGGRTLGYKYAFWLPVCPPKNLLRRLLDLWFRLRLLQKQDNSNRRLVSTQRKSRLTPPRPTTSTKEEFIALLIHLLVSLILVCRSDHLFGLTWMVIEG